MVFYYQHSTMPNLFFYCVAWENNVITDNTRFLLFLCWHLLWLSLLPVACLASCWRNQVDSKKISSKRYFLTKTQKTASVENAFLILFLTLSWYFELASSSAQKEEGTLSCWQKLTRYYDIRSKHEESFFIPAAGKENLQSLEQHVFSSLFYSTIL